MKNRKTNKKIKPRFFDIEISYLGISLPIILLSGYFFYAPDFLNYIDREIEEVVVIGDFNFVTPSEIEQIITEENNLSFFGINLEELHQKVIAIGWVDQLQITKQWPTTLKIEFTEQVPQARWGTNALVNKNTEIFPVSNAEDFSYLPMIFGNSNEVKQIYDIYSSLNHKAANRGSTLTELRKDDRGAWTMVIDDSLQVNFGISDINNAAEFFFSDVYEEISETIKSIEMVDLRYNNGFSVRYKNNLNHEDLNT